MDEAAFERLLRRARRREPDALDELFERYGRRVYGLLYRLTGSRDAADDLLQSTFLRVVRMLPAYVHNGRFEAWLFRIAANLVRDRARALARERRTVATRPEFESGPPEAGPDASRSLAPDEQLARREADARLLDALAALSDAEREIILLRHYSGLPFRQIAEMLDIPLGTALSRAHRALSHLRRLLGGSG